MGDGPKEPWEAADIVVAVCGIVGYVGRRPARELLLAGLRKLEYRGYDSAGISLIVEDHIEAVRSVGNLSALQAKLDGGIDQSDGGTAVAVMVEPGLASTTGIGHTRWATHGRVSEENAHPHYDPQDRLHVVVNGIVENYMALKERLTAEGNMFTSETDAEVIAHLVAAHYEGDLAGAVRSAFNQLEGHFAFVAMSADEPDRLVGARKECPLVVGRGEGEQFIASAVPAFLAQTRSVQYVENGELVVLRPEGVTILTSTGETVERPVERIDWDEDTAEKGGYETFMLKEIHEQADAVAETIADRVAHGEGVDLDEHGALDEAILADIKRVVIVACGTSYHAGLIGRYAIEEWARVPVEMDVASEYRYRNPVVGPGDLVIGISQSGETADTLAAMRRARERGATVLAITNVMGSQATRDADGVLFTRAGLEIGVAATKTFVCQVAVIYLLGLRLAELRGTLAGERVTELVREIKRLPHCIDQVIADLDEQIGEVAEAHWQKEFFLYIGRHVGLPVALEGALKLKEISYIATDAYAAGEMKHGPIALLDESTPVVCVATDSPVLEKMVSNMQEVRARGAHVIAVTTKGNTRLEDQVDVAIPVPSVDWMLQPILAVIPLQMLAYEIARRRGLNVDQPRNLAKTVTVE
ncbi:MAG TPA: glutamine--fructose-6-phosphate transaminase (isomerizing) [Solirubrobacteraceae bacterium]|jgi:glucosamine--fructose-6-phosphate aminotransferase (isomerizing)|nr:glutamine--fructose-6-phosphate transaminase (isomerizing) [Solirubrobacteraceae bacterium]